MTRPDKPDANTIAPDTSEPLLFFGGPYSNFEATRALRERAQPLSIEPSRIVCTGDIVAYCAEPAETVELIRDWGVHVIMGNCEESLAASEADCGCGFEPDSSCSVLAINWYRYADRRVDIGQRRWMQSLPRNLDFELGATKFRVVHGSVERINEFVFASDDVERKRAQIEAAGVDVTASPDDATATLTILNDLTGQRVLSVSARNVPTEFEVFYTIRYAITNDDGSLLEPQELTLTRDYTYDATLVLGKEKEEQLMRDAIVGDLVRIVMEQISTI